jgi:glucokinase
MKAGRSSILALVIVCAMAVTATAPASAQSSTPIGGVTKSDAAWIVVAIAAIGAGIGIGIYYAVHHNQRLTGCAVAGEHGLELQSVDDRQMYILVGTIATIKPGERVRVSGKRVRGSVGPIPQFLVEHLSKDYGACPASPATP